MNDKETQFFFNTRTPFPLVFFRPFLYDSERVNDLSLTQKANDPEIFIVFNKNIFHYEQDQASFYPKARWVQKGLESVLSVKNKSSKKLPQKLPPQKI